MITSTAVFSTALTDAKKVFTSTSTGLTGGTEQLSAITTMMFCNTGLPSLTNELTNDVQINVYLVKKGQTPNSTNQVVNRLNIPASETVMFNEERIILDNGDMVYVSTSTPDIETVGSFTPNANYTIASVGDTDFTLLGASSNTAGVTFTASSDGTGNGTTGTAYRNLLSVTVSSLPV